MKEELDSQIHVEDGKVAKAQENTCAKSDEPASVPVTDRRTTNGVSRSPAVEPSREAPVLAKRWMSDGIKVMGMVEAANARSIMQTMLVIVTGTRSEVINLI